MTVTQQKTTRQILESRLGKPLGPLALMRPDLRLAMYKLALQLVKVKDSKTPVKGAIK